MNIKVFECPDGTSVAINIDQWPVASVRTKVNVGIDQRGEETRTPVGMTWSIGKLEPSPVSRMVSIVRFADGGEIEAYGSVAEIVAMLNAERTP